MGDFMLGEEVLFLAFKLPDNTVPRVGKIVGVHEDGMVDVAVFQRAAEYEQNGEAVRVIPRVKPFLDAEVRGNRLGSETEWDWSLTGLRFVCRTLPKVIPQKREKAEKAEAAEPVPVPPPVTKDPEVPDGPPRVPTPRTTMRLKIKPGASSDF